MRLDSESARLPHCTVFLDYILPSEDADHHGQRANEIPSSLSWTQTQSQSVTYGKAPPLPTDELHDIGKPSRQDSAVEMLQNITPATRTKFLAQHGIAI